MLGQDGGCASWLQTASPSTETRWRARFASGPSWSWWAQAGDGREALEAIGAAQPDVAVIDRTLAGLSGKQV